MDEGILDGLALASAAQGDRTGVAAADGLSDELAAGLRARLARLGRDREAELRRWAAGLRPPELPPAVEAVLTEAVDAELREALHRLVPAHSARPRARGAVLDRWAPALAAARGLRAEDVRRRLADPTDEPYGAVGAELAEAAPWSG